jgi:hypothetical protein
MDSQRDNDTLSHKRLAVPLGALWAALASGNEPRIDAARAALLAARQAAALSALWSELGRLGTQLANAANVGAASAQRAASPRSVNIPPGVR